MERSHNYTYKITNNINNKYYYGVHCTDDLDDGYMGSGELIKAAIEKYGIENFTKVILEFFDTAAEAYSRETELVTMKEVNDPMCYNLKEGGQGGSIKRFTDEEIKERLREQQHKYQQEYFQRPEVKEHKRKYTREYIQRPEVKEKVRVKHKEYYQRPEVKERQQRYQQEYYQRKKQQKENIIK